MYKTLYEYVLETIDLSMIIVSYIILILYLHKRFSNGPLD